MPLFLSALIALLAPQAGESGASPEGAPEDPEDWLSGSMAAGPWTDRGLAAPSRFPSPSSLDLPGGAALPEGDPKTRESVRKIDFLVTIPPGPGGWTTRAPPGGAPDAQSAPLTPHGSCEGFFLRHGSSSAWRDDVWQDNLATPCVPLPWDWPSPPQ